MREFEIAQEATTDASQAETWAAITTGSAGWLWPQPELTADAAGAAGAGGAIVEWDPPHRWVGYETGENGWYNRLEAQVTAREDGGSTLRWVHSGMFVDSWDDQYDGVTQHTAFYLHTLQEYLQHFRGRDAVWTHVEAPVGGPGGAPDALDVLRATLGVPTDAVVGDEVTVTLPGGPTSAVVDYVHPHFLGLRTEDALVRVFGRNAFGHVVGVAVHDFADTPSSSDETAAAWTDLLTRTYGG